jgi:hypothetical protein
VVRTQLLAAGPQTRDPAAVLKTQANSPPAQATLTSQKSSHKKAQKAQKISLLHFVIFVPFCGWIFFSAFLWHSLPAGNCQRLRDERATINISIKNDSNFFIFIKIPLGILVVLDLDDNSRFARLNQRERKPVARETRDTPISFKEHLSV